VQTRVGLGSATTRGLGIRHDFENPQQLEDEIVLLLAGYLGQQTVSPSPGTE
jgi:hypothetical protein